MPEALADLYRHLHAHPELAYAEFETAATAAEHARKTGYEVTEGIGGTGVVAMLRNGPGPTVLLRADMDALPLTECTDLPYASVNPGVMHACGHDMHVTWLLGTMAELYQTQTQWSGSVMAVFQPAEEGGNGAQAMIRDGIFDRFGKPDVALGQHLTSLPSGSTGFGSGPFMAASDEFHIRLFGRGGHGSQPEATIDPVVMAAATVMRLQTLVSREISPSERAVLTVGAINAGTKSNIIAAEAELLITTRSFSEEVRRKLAGGLRRIVLAEAMASGVDKQPEIIHKAGYPVLVNDPDATSRTAGVLRDALGASRVREQKAVMGAEDFADFGRACGVPSVFWFTGGTDADHYARAEEAGRLEQDLIPNHSPFFAPVLEPTLRTGIDALTTAARAWLAPGPGGRSDFGPTAASTADTAHNQRP
jgi:amidohydrolase